MKSAPSVASAVLASLLAAACADEPVAPPTLAPDAPALSLAPALDSALTLAGGDDHVCGLDTAGGAWCWGDNGQHQLARATTSETCGFGSCSSRPLRVLGRRFSRLAAGANHTCGIDRETAAVWCWGANGDGQLGDGTVSSSSAQPVQVAAPGDFVTVTAGLAHTCALAGDGHVWCWGANDLGQTTGPATGYPAPRLLPGTRTYLMVSAGEQHTCAVASNRFAYCWGWNGFDQLGDSAAGALSRVPLRVDGGGGYDWISAGSEHTCAIRGAARYAWCWGTNGDLQLGRSGPGGPAPTRVAGSRAFAQLSAGPYHTCGLETAGRIACWGLNDENQLGRGSNVDSPLLPARIPGLRLYASLAEGDGSGGCAADGAGAVYCWGRNESGQAGRDPALSADCYGSPCEPSPRRVRGTVPFE